MDTPHTGADPDVETHPPRVTLLVAHGSRNPAAQDAHEALVAEVRRATDDRGSSDRVLPAYLELAEPSVPAAIDAAVADGAASVVILPCFLHPGNHVLVDLPEIAEQARSRHPSVGIIVRPHLGADPALAGLLARAISGDSVTGDGGGAS